MVSAGHAKMASVPTAPRATDGLANALSGYSAAITAAAAGGTPTGGGIMLWEFDAVTGLPSSSLSATKSRHSSWLVPLMIGTRLKLPVAKAVPSDSGSTSLLMFGV